MTTSSVASPAVERPPLRLFLTLLHLVAIGTVGTVVITVVPTLFGVGVGTALVFGVGLVLLVALVYVLFGVGWFEIARVDGLYRFGLAPLQFVPRDRPGFGGWLKSLARQSVNGRMWRALANFLLTWLMGTVVLWLLGAIVRGVFFAFTPLTSQADMSSPFWWFQIGTPWAPLFGLLGAAICALLIFLLVLLHRTLSTAIIAGPDRVAALNRRVAVSAEQRAGAVRAADVERTRIERDLHDGVQPRLVSVGMTLGLAQQKIEDDPAQAKALIEEAHTSTKAAITELRQLARGIHASVLDDRGLDAALSALAGRSHIPVQLDVRMDGRCSRDAEAAVYFSIAESLTNAAKHSRASECRVIVRLRPDGVLWARVEDNGIGGAQVLPGGGLDGITNRILGAGGTFRLDSPVGGPTALEVSVPCAS